MNTKLGTYYHNSIPQLTGEFRNTVTPLSLRVLEQATSTYWPACLIT